MSLILDGTNGLSDVDGTAGTPAIRGSDANTGVFFGTDIVGVSTGGSERMRVDASGNVGIGTSSPAKQLDLAASNTGITTGDPLNTLRFTDTDTTSAAGQPMGRIEWFSADNDTAGVKAYIQAQATDGSPDADMVFATNHVSGGGTAERMRIQYDGNVGIGTSSPAQRLTVGLLGAFRLQTGSVTMDCTPTAGATDSFVWNTSANSPYVWSHNGTERARIDSSGNLLVGKTSTSSTATGVIAYGTGAADHGMISVARGSNATMIEFRTTASGNVVGQISQNGTNTTYSTSSDYRLKENIQPMTGALVKVAALKPVTYTWKETGEADEGFIAHELQEVCPSAVSGEKDAVNEDGSIKPQGIDTSFLVATLTAAIQEQQALIESLTARVVALEGQP